MRRASLGARSRGNRRAQGDDDAEEAAEDEAEDDAADAQAEADAAKPPPKAAPEPERQLSKKELKKKELEDMEAVLAELGISVPARPRCPMRVTVASGSPLWHAPYAG